MHVCLHHTIGQRAAEVVHAGIVGQPRQTAPSQWVKLYDASTRRVYSCMCDCCASSPCARDGAVSPTLGSLGVANVRTCLRVCCPPPFFDLEQRLRKSLGKATNKIDANTHRLPDGVGTNILFVEVPYIDMIVSYVFFGYTSCFNLVENQLWYLIKGTSAK